MSWQDRSLALVERFGPGAKFAVRTILLALPGSPAVVETAWQALASVYRTAKKNWKIRRRTRLQASPADEERLEQLLEMLSDDWSSLVARLAALEASPAEARRILAAILATDASVRGGMVRLDALVQSFDQSRLPLAPPQEQFPDLPLRDGLRYGCWRLWLLDSSIGLLISNLETGTFIRIWLDCNGWFEYRTARVNPGRIFTVWSSGNQTLDPGRYLGSLNGHGPPRWGLSEGVYPAQAWHVEVAASRFTIEHPATGRKLSFERDRPIWDCNDVQWNDPGRYSER